MEQKKIKWVKIVLDKDNNRQLEIINYLKCDFIRLNENGGEILNIKYKNGN